MILMSSWSYFLSCSTALDGDGCWSMSIQFVVRLVCMSADIGGVDLSSAAWLAVERSSRCILRQWWGLIALVLVGGCSWVWLVGGGRGSGCGRGGWVDRPSATWLWRSQQVPGDRRLVVGRLLVNLWGDWCQNHKNDHKKRSQNKKNDHKITKWRSQKTITKCDHKKRSQNFVTVCYDLIFCLVTIGIIIFFNQFTVFGKSSLCCRIPLPALQSAPGQMLVKV